MMRENTRRKCGETVCVKSELKEGEARGNDDGMERGMEGSEGRKTSEDGRGKGRKFVCIKSQRGREMNERGDKTRNEKKRKEKKRKEKSPD